VSLEIEMISVELVNYVIQVKISFGNKIIIDCVFYLPKKEKRENMREKKYGRATTHISCAFR
jgi:energy-converting hydrogenase Eha subunit B